MISYNSYMVTTLKRQALQRGERGAYTRFSEFAIVGQALRPAALGQPMRSPYNSFNRVRSCESTMPTGTLSSSITTRSSMRWRSSRFRTSTASLSLCTVTGFSVIRSATSRSPMLGIGLKMPHEIAVGENAEQLVVLAGHNGSAGAHAGHRFEHVAYRRVGRDNRHRFTRPHDLMHAHQHAAADHSAGMKFREIFLVKPARLQAAPSPARRPAPASPSCSKSARDSADKLPVRCLHRDKHARFAPALILDRRKWR